MYGKEELEALRRLSDRALSLAEEQLPLLGAENLACGDFDALTLAQAARFNALAELYAALADSAGTARYASRGQRDCALEGSGAFKFLLRACKEPRDGVSSAVEYAKELLSWKL